MPTSTTDTEVKCYHCGETCEPNDTIHYDDRNFCCQGCKSVYQILQEADLYEIYNLDDRASTVKPSDKRKYRILVDPELAKAFIEFEGQGLARVTFFAPGIHCSSCIWLLEHMGRLHPGIMQSTVQFVKKEVTITYSSDLITLKEVAELMDKIGYGPIVEPRKLQKSSSSDLIIRLGVAGFCFGNSMLISLPDYLDLNYQIPEDYRTIFGYINLAFSLPVFFYSAQVYFISAWKGLKHKFVNIDVPISMGIIALFVRSLIDILYFHQMGFVDSLAGLVFFLLIGRWFQHKTYQALSFDRDVGSYFPIAVSKWVDGQEVTTRIEELEEDDELIIHNQELIPADAILVEGQASIDYSFVTGESLPAPIAIGEKLFAGGRQLGGPIIVRLKRRVLNSHLTKLWNQSEQHQDHSRLNNLSDLISRYFTAAVIILALLGGVIWYFKDPSQVINVFTAILIVACPCALALAVPFTYGHTLRIFGQKGLYLKHAHVIEQLSRIKRIVFDKTGTLTRPLPEDISYHGDNLSEEQLTQIYNVAANSIHPLSKIIKKHLSIKLQRKINQIRWDEYDEVAGKGVLARSGDTIVRLGSGSWLGVTNQDNNHLTSVHIEIDRVYKGYYKFGNAYREGVLDAIASLKQDYTLELLSGDHPSESERLQPYFHILKFRQTPEDKYQHVTQIRAGNESIMMIGDGLNDAGALSASDVGVSLADDIYQFTPASDAILAAPNLVSVGRFLRFSRVAVKIVWVSFGISFFYNLAGLSFAFMGKLTPLVSSLLMPISSVSVVGFITLAAHLYAKKLLKDASSH